MTINEFRIAKKLTMEELANNLSITFSYCSKLCYGEREASKGILKKIKSVWKDTDMNIFFSEKSA